MAKTLEQLEEDIKAVTSRLTLIDKVMKAARLGLTMVPVFQCGHSGLFYPSDFAKLWGVDYGIGLGPDVVSECLDTEYALAPPAISPGVKRLSDITHPMKVCKAQVDLDLVSEDVYEAHRLIAAKDDPDMVKRAAIVLKRQLKNSEALRLLHAQYSMERGQ